MPDEAALIAAIHAGDKQAFGALYEAYVKPIYNFIYYKTHHKETAEDLVSQTFMKAYNHFASYEPAKGTFSAWLYRIARNLVVDYYRSKKLATIDIEDAWDLSSDENIAEDTHNKLLFAEVKKYFKELTAEQRDILTMRLWQEMSYQEIAEVLGKSEGSCKMAFSRAIQKLRERMPIAMFIALLMSRGAWF
jgi:RNA polymerase sigma-70 factor, ECF subfamily